jgi:hypothetical protein
MKGFNEAQELELFDQIMQGLNRARDHPSWLKEGGRFIPGLATFLSDKQWRNFNDAKSGQGKFDDWK